MNRTFRSEIVITSACARMVGAMQAHAQPNIGRLGNTTSRSHASAKSAAGIAGGAGADRETLSHIEEQCMQTKNAQSSAKGKRRDAKE
ncbi:hypothetical protein AWB82_02774 [Caballeronia glebae]|uniref:Uncharacterized protein n=1 Tax=Caballeronia glebae TaxID=1777143 RepID=A0A158AQK8_9BURK|nr:hypothetical protein [Caballeronia glebae]SAK60009.1 hypothetical protein AWB82_02774 [Caballeronia glebae]